MIPLWLKARTEGDSREAFVVKAVRDGGDASEPCVRPETSAEHMAVLAGELASQLVFRTARGYLHLAGASMSELDGDVLYVDARRGTAHRWIRARSPHNTLLLTERCDQLCVMCSQPPKETHVDLFSHFNAALLLAPPGMVIGFSGGEPTLYKDLLFDLIEATAKVRPDLRYHVLTNAQHFTDEDLPRLRETGRNGVCWGVPLYAGSAALHDEIVGKQGAYDRLLESLALMLRAGASVELRTVLMKSNAAALPALAWFVATHLGFIQTWAIMQLENIGFARMRWDALFYDHSRDFSYIARAIDIATGRGADVQLYNCPLCTVPADYRELAGRTISDWKQRYLDRCAPCGQRKNCAGFFEWYPEERGFEGVRPL